MPAACCGCHHPVGQLVPLVLSISIWQRLHTFHTLLNRHNDCYRPEMAEEAEVLPSPPSSPKRLEEVEVLPSPPPSPNRPVEVEDTPPTSLPPPPLLPPAPRKALLGPPPPPVTPLTNTLRAMEKSIAQQTARFFLFLSFQKLKVGWIKWVWEIFDAPHGAFRLYKICFS